MKAAELMAARYNNPMRSLMPGTVFQVWNDGEITLQKSGTKLNKFPLHTVLPALLTPIPGLVFPEKSADGYSFAYVTRDEAEMIRTLAQQVSSF